jgi:hypothetical protein
LVDSALIRQEFPPSKRISADARGTDQRLEQDFNSLNAEYDASQAYIRRHSGPSTKESAVLSRRLQASCISSTPPLNVLSRQAA